MSEKGVFQKLQHIVARLMASGNRRPNALAPRPTLFAASALRHLPVENHKTYRLLRQIVGRIVTVHESETAFR